MSRRVKVLISVLVATLLMVAGSATVALAQEEPQEEPQTTLRSGLEGILARAAEILGVSQDDLATAFEQAWQEVREENQSTENCTLENRTVSQAGQQRWVERRQEMGKGFQGSQMDSQNTARFRISQSVRGRQMIAVPEGWGGTRLPGLVD